MAGHWRKPLKSPPFAKGGLGGFYTYIYIYIYTSPGTAANPMLGAERRWQAGCCQGCGAVLKQRRGNPSNPPFAKGGLFRGLRRS